MISFFFLFFFSVPLDNFCTYKKCQLHGLTLLKLVEASLTPETKKYWVDDQQHQSYFMGRKRYHVTLICVATSDGVIIKITYL